MGSEMCIRDRMPITKICARSGFALLILKVLGSRGAPLQVVLRASELYVGLIITDNADTLMTR